MLAVPKAISQLIRQFNRLPGIGQKTSERFVYHLLKQTGGDIDSLAQTILTLKQIKRCRDCFTYTETELCMVCQDTNRDRSTLCVIAEARDMIAIQQTGSYHGLYHVLGGVIDHTAGIGPNQLRIDALVQRVQRQPIEEIIIATNHESEGEITALYLTQQLQSVTGRDAVTITRIARGLPMGASIEFADDMTLSSALTARQRISS